MLYLKMSNQYNVITDMSNTRQPLFDICNSGVSRIDFLDGMDVLSSVDLRDKFSFPVMDEGSLYASVECTLTSMYMLHKKECCTMAGKECTDEPKSFLYLYWYDHFFNNQVLYDTNISIGDGVRNLLIGGIADESLWPNTMPFDQEPSQEAILDAQTCRRICSRCVSRMSIGLTLFKTVLSVGNPIAVGMKTFLSFDSESMNTNGILPMPQENEQLLGGVCVMLVGYDDAREVFLVRHSRGPNWGNNGYFEMPYAYLQYLFDPYTFHNITLRF